MDVGLRADGERGALLEVSDEGPGVPPEERERIFGRFARGRHAPGGGDRPDVPGLGLGLSLVAGIVAWHGGEVDVSNGPRGGSLFRVRLPRPGASGAR